MKRGDDIMEFKFTTIFLILVEILSLAVLIKDLVSGIFNVLILAIVIIVGFILYNGLKNK